MHLNNDVVKLKAMKTRFCSARRRLSYGIRHRIADDDDDNNNDNNENH